jgi:hypothetical protein
MIQILGYLIYYHAWIISFTMKVSMVMKMATLEKAEKLLEDLRTTSWNSVLKGIWNVVENFVDTYLIK